MDAADQIGDDDTATNGAFTETNTAFSGAVKTQTLNVKTTIRTADKARDYRLFAGAIEFGAAWKKTSRDGRTTSLSNWTIRAFPQIYASLIDGDDGESHLIWSRRSGD